jgi:glycosyltransferase involved in cell wall biosynthesis
MRKVDQANSSMRVHRKPSMAEFKDPAVSTGHATVAVIIPTFNHARCLADAITSVLAQTREADEIIVVDDGSNDDPATAAAQFPQVKLVRQDNRGPAAARNTGLQNCTASYVVFLDADDRLLPKALEAGLACIADRPDCAFVYGGYRLVSETGQHIGLVRPNPIDGDAHLAMLRGEAVLGIMTMLFRRDCLLAMNGFNETPRTSEDLDLKLRITQKYPIACHSEIVAEYRRHGENTSNRHVDMLESALLVLDRHATRIAIDPVTRAAVREGRASRKGYYVSQMLAAASARWRVRHDIGILVRDLVQAARWAPFLTIRMLLGALGRRASMVLPRPIVRWMEWIRGRPYPIPIGSVHFGDLRRLTPISHSIVSDRGTALDRYYIESFLSRNASDIRGRVLEADDDNYTQRFGGIRVERSDIVCIETTNPRATIVGDIVQPGTLPEAAFDCIILTHVLQYVFDLQDAAATLYRALRPGGVLLVTAPGISKIELYKRPWYWGFRAPALRRLFEDQFGQDGVTVEAHGNVLAATAFLHGIASEELTFTELNAGDTNYPVIVAARAIKQETHESS